MKSRNGNQKHLERIEGFGIEHSEKVATGSGRQKSREDLIGALPEEEEGLRCRIVDFILRLKLFKIKQDFEHIQVKQKAPVISGCHTVPAPAIGQSQG